MKNGWHEIHAEVRRASEQQPECRPGQAFCIMYMIQNGERHPEEDFIWEMERATDVIHHLFSSERNQ